MYGCFLGNPSNDLTSDWAEDGYRRLTTDAIEPDNPVRFFHEYYCRLADGRVPSWRSFDVCDVPTAVMPHIALADPVYRSFCSAAPDHFVYSLEGGGVRSFVGISMLGRKVGHVMRQTNRNSVIDEITTTLESNRPTLACADLDIPEQQDLQFTRGVFHFRGDHHEVERLLLVLFQHPPARVATQRRQAESSLPLFAYSGHPAQRGRIGANTVVEADELELFVR